MEFQKAGGSSRGKLYNVVGKLDMTRMKSMKVDENDLEKLKSGMNKIEGTTMGKDMYQLNPFFFTREMAPVNIVGQYRGGTAFLIAGGPSFSNVRQKYLRRAGIWTMTVNNAVKSFRGNAAIVVDDPHRFTYSMWIDPKIQKFIPTAMFEAQLWDNRLTYEKSGTKQLWQPTKIKVGDCPNVVGYRRNEKFMAKRYLHEDTINWGNHENLCFCGKGERKERGEACPACGKKDQFGSRSVFLAALRVLFLLGFREVYLLGVDFEMSDTKKYHFDEGRTPHAIKNNTSTYSKLIKWMEELQPYFLAENFKVYNCNPDSKLRAFPFVNYKDAVDKVARAMGDTDNEKTAGLYSNYEEKMASFIAASNPNPTVNPNPVIVDQHGAPIIPIKDIEVKFAQGTPVDLGCKG